MQLIYALALGLLTAYDSVRRRRLTPSGAVAAMLVGIATAYNPSNVFTVLLFGFFLTSSKLTKVKSRRGWILCYIKLNKLP
jgi:uncharacterized membrane protein